MNATTRTRVRTAVGALAVAAVASVGSIAAVSPSSAAVEATPPATDTTEDAELVDAWLDLWNGDHARAEGIVSPDVAVHAAMLDGGDGSAVRGPEGMVGWIAQTRSAIPDLEFSIEVGPIVDGDHIALRWTAEGTYAGGMPGAAAPAGTPIAFTGTDLLRTEDGQVAEYWLNADALGLVTQLQVQAG
jgi:predicted ester cyclase